MFAQTIRTPLPLPAGEGEQTPQLPSGSAQTPAQLEAMMKAIQNGNTVELQRMIFNPQPA